MWQVIATDGTRERHVVTSRWRRANHLARKALDLGWRVRIKTVLADVLIANADGDFTIIATKIKAKDAARFTLAWLKESSVPSPGCVLWPHGRPMPHGWKVIG
jgi:hypothetical protein